MIILIIAHTSLQASVDISVTLTDISSSTLKEGREGHYFNEESSQATISVQTKHSWGAAKQGRGCVRWENTPIGCSSDICQEIPSEVTRHSFKRLTSIESCFHSTSYTYWVTLGV